MRFLFVSNYYPPHHLGGYELHCARLACWLVRAGHSVSILTSDYRSPHAPASGELEDAVGPAIERSLRLRYWRDVADPGFWLREWRDLGRFRRSLDRVRPDIVVLWNMRKLAAGIVLEAQRRAPVLVHHLMDEWLAEFRAGNGLPQFWSRPAASRPGRLLKPLLRRAYRALFTPDLSDWRPENAVLVSRALGDLLRANGIVLRKSIVSYITYDAEQFRLDWDRSGDPPEPVRFLWAGRLCGGKGLFTTLRALDLLHGRTPVDWCVDFCGPLDEADRPAMEALVRGKPWAGRVRHLGALPPAAMPRAYRDHDAFLFTSEVHEGLPGTIIEAFAAGLPLIGTLTGGTRDVLRPGENCLTYPAGDAPALAAAMLRLLENPGLRRSLADGVATFAREECSSDAVFPRLVSFYEALLREKGSCPSCP